MSGFYADQAASAATSDRAAVADQVLDIACVEAAGILRIGLVHGDRSAPAEARRVLAKAQGSADRILGPVPVDGAVAS